jgi:hypothetical protein
MAIDTYTHDWRNSVKKVRWGFGKCGDCNGEMRRDLFNRKMQRRDDLLSVLKKIHPEGNCDGDVFVAGINKFSLRPDSCGSWVKNYQGRNFEQYAQRAKTTDLESYAVSHLGMPESIACEYLARHGNVSLSYEERYLFSDKPGYSAVRSFEESCLDDYPREMNPLEAHGYQFEKMYPYKNADGTIHHYVCVFKSPEGESVELPLTLWEAPDRDRIFDWLHPVAPYPLYQGDLLRGNSRCVLVCENEAQVEYFRENHSWLSQDVCLTTWSGGMSKSIDETDWGPLAERWTGIIVAPSREGFKQADKLYCTLRRAGVAPIGFLMPFARLEADRESAKAMRLALDKDVVESMLQKGEIADRAEFVKEARDRFDLNFDHDYAATAISGRELLSLPVSDAEAVLGPMIMKGDRVLLYAHRGSGKTWLICFVAVACVSGKSLFDRQLVAPRPLRVLIIDGEMGARELQKRYSMIFKAMGTPEHLQDNLRIVAARIQGKDIRLETPEERERFKEDIAWADVIIADSMFCLFPSAMGSQLEGAQGFNEFMRANSLQGKTTIVVDHTGKNKRNSYGTIGKELGLELVLKLEKVKNSEMFRLSVEKHRNLGSEDVQPIEYILLVDKDEGVANLIVLSELEEDLDSEEGGEACNNEPAFSDCDTNDVLSVSDSGLGALISHDDLDSKIIAALEADPYLSVRALAEKVGTSKSTAQARRKQLEDGGLVAPKPSGKGPTG